MRYPASEKLGIIRLVEQSHLPVRRTLEKLGIQPARFYRWYDRLLTGGPEALEDKSPRPKRVWNCIPDRIRERVVQLALDEPELSPRELATRFTDTANYFVSEASVYRLLKAQDLITRDPPPAISRSRLQTQRRFIHAGHRPIVSHGEECCSQTARRSRRARTRAHIVFSNDSTTTAPDASRWVCSREREIAGGGSLVIRSWALSSR